MLTSNRLFTMYSIIILLFLLSNPSVGFKNILYIQNNIHSVSKSSRLSTSSTFYSISKQNRWNPYQKSFQPLHLFPDLSILPNFQSGFLINSLLASLLYFSSQKSLTKAGLFHSYILGLGLWTFLGIQGWFIGVAYFILGSIATKKLGIAEKRGGERGPENVWGSAATGMICVLLGYLFPSYHMIFRLGYISSMATKLSDTFASEIGKAFGKTTFLVTTFQRVPKGTEGAVSVEGTLAGVIGSILIAWLGYSLQLVSMSDILFCMIAAVIANFMESYIGAIYQNKIPWLTNELVNFINTSIGAVIAMLLSLWLIK